MNQGKEIGPGNPVWIDTTKKIISFKNEEGFEQLSFPSHDEMLAFVIEKGSSGYRIQ